MAPELPESPGSGISVEYCRISPSKEWQALLMIESAGTPDVSLLEEKINVIEFDVSTLGGKK